MVRYTLKEFEAAGLEPQKCDSGPYGIHTAPDEPKYWFPCSYHEGYIDGFRDAKDLVRKHVRLRDDECSYCRGAGIVFRSNDDMWVGCPACGFSDPTPTCSVESEQTTWTSFCGKSEKVARRMGDE